MSRERNITNLKTEKEGILILKKHISNFLIPTSEERKRIYKILDIDYRKYSRSVDGIILNVPNVDDIKNENDLTLVEIKTTKAKNITQLPYGAFFGITQNEEDLFKSRNNFRLCIVHSITEDYVLINYDQYNSLIQNKRVQYQVNFKSKE
jgi:hypothetical protein